MYVCIYVSIYVCIYVSMYVCMYIYIDKYVWIDIISGEDVQNN